MRLVGESAKINWSMFGCAGGTWLVGEVRMCGGRSVEGLETHLHDSVDAEQTHDTTRGGICCCSVSDHDGVAW